MHNMMGNACPQTIQQMLDASHQPRRRPHSARAASISSEEAGTPASATLTVLCEAWESVQSSSSVDPPSSSCSGLAAACAHAHSRVKPGLLRRDRVSRGCCDEDDTTVTAESTLAVRDSAGYGRPVTLCSPLLRLRVRLGGWEPEGGDDGGEEGMWDHNGCGSCDWLNLMGLTGDWISDREATRSRDGRGFAEPREAAPGVGEIVVRGGALGRLGEDDDGDDDDSEWPPASAAALAVFFTICLLFWSQIVTERSSLRTTTELGHN